MVQERRSEGLWPGTAGAFREIGEEQHGVLELFKEGVAACREGRAPRPPVYITGGTREQVLYFDGRRLVVRNRLTYRFDTIGVPVIIEGPGLFYYAVFNVKHADDLVTAFQEYIKKTS